MMGGSFSVGQAASLPLPPSCELHAISRVAQWQARSLPYGRRASWRPVADELGRLFPPSRPLLAQPGVARQRQEREVQAVVVILQVEHFREARPGERLLVPAAVGPLSPQQVLDA